MNDTLTHIEITVSIEDHNHSETTTLSSRVTDIAIHVQGCHVHVAAFDAVTAQYMYVVSKLEESEQLRQHHNGSG